MISADIKLSRASGFSLDVALELQPGVTALYGPSGAGKSTILKLIAGLERGSSRDRITIASDGVTWQGAGDFLPPHRRRVGYVPQRPSLFPHLSVRGNLAYAEKRAEDARRPSVSQINEWLELDALMEKPVRQLSGGEAQRVAIGRALLTGAKCLLMDEPLGALDQAARRRILPCLDRLHQELEATMVYVSHSLEEVNYLADRVYILEQGRVKSSGSVFETSTSLEVAEHEGESLAAVLECTVKDYDPDFELTELTLGRHSLFVPSGQRRIGSHCRIRIPARDVSIALSQSGDTSIINILPAVVDDIDAGSGPGALVKLAVDDQYLLARITRKSLNSLTLSRGMPVYVQIKGVALLTDHD